MQPLPRGPIPLGMVGGGQGALIGGVHRIAARLDGAFHLVAGALSSTPEKARASAADLRLDPKRSYGSFAEMAEAEAQRPDGIRAVSIVTPNHMHAAPAIEFLRRGIHVICDKPLTATMDEARELAKVARSAKALFILTHNYTGYPLVRQARALVQEGALGHIRLVHVEYFQDWLTEAAELAGSKQAEWRTDPERSGLGGALGDIGTHAYNLANFILNAAPQELAAETSAFGTGRQLDDNAHVLLRYASGARGTLLASQVAPGNENGLRIRIYGDKAGLEWAQENPNQLWISPFGKPKYLLTRGGAGMDAAAERVTRVPGGHPEGYLEAFATLYAEAARAIHAFDSGAPCPAEVAFPSLEDGLAGMRFVEACVQSSKANAAWVTL